MTAKELPSRPNLDQYKKQAKDLLKSYNLGDADAFTRVTQHHPKFAKAVSATDAGTFHLSDAQWVIAREHGFESWASFADHVRKTAAQNFESTQSFAKPIFTIDLDIKSEEVNTCVFTRDGKQAVMCAQGTPVRVWEVETGRSVRTFDSDSVSAWAAIWGPDERHVFLGTRDGIVQMWDVGSNRRLHAFEGHYGLMRCLDVSADGSRLLSATAFRDNTLRLWDVNSESCQKVMEGHSDGIYDVAFDAAQRQALTGSRDGTIRIWDLETGKCRQVLKRHSYHVHSVLWSNDQRRVLSSSQDIRLWDVETGRCIRVFDQEHTQVIRRLAWSADQRTALSASHDGTVRLWDVDNGRCLHVFEGHRAGVVSVAYGADERLAHSCDWSGQIRVWDLASI